MEVLSNIDYHIINRCNLNCKACGHFAPLVPKNEPYINLERAKKELDLLYEKIEHGNRFNRLTLTGGEVTLNPDLFDIAKYAVKLFPNKIRIWTNAINIDKFIENKDFIIENNIIVFSTDYGKLNTENINKLLDEHILDTYIASHNTEDVQVIDDWYYQFFNQGNTPYEAAKWCLNNRLDCIQYKDYKLYHCQYSAYFKYFSDYFKGQHNINYYDYGLDLNTINSFEDIRNFLLTPVMICKYCNDIIGRTKHGTWEISKKDISEWIE